MDVYGSNVRGCVRDVLRHMLDGLNAFDQTVIATSFSAPPPPTIEDVCAHLSACYNDPRPESVQYAADVIDAFLKAGGA